MGGFRGGDRTKHRPARVAAAAARAHHGARQANRAGAAQRKCGRHHLGEGARARDRAGVVSRPGGGYRDRGCAVRRLQPGGRLPITFYNSVDDLPRSMTTRWTVEPTASSTATRSSVRSRSQLHDLRVRESARQQRQLAADGESASRERCQHRAARGDEVVQLYVQHPQSRVTRPRLDLRGFRRITLAPGQTRTVEFQLPGSALRYWDPDGKRWVVEDAPLRIIVGSSSEDLRLDRTIRVFNRP